MTDAYNNDYEERLLTAGGEEEVAEEVENENENTVSDEYYELPLAIKSRTLLWSMVSFVLGALSLSLCLFYYISIPFAIASVIFSMVSRRNLGFFEKYSIMGLVFGLMGAVASAFCLIASSIGLM